MFTDIVDYSTAVQADEAKALRMLREEEELVRPLFVTHHGREIKSTGDGFLVEFDSALHAVECGHAILERVREHNDRSGASSIQLRVGIHLGDVEGRNGDIFGDAVNIASRIESVAPPNGLCISAQVFDQVRNKVPYRLDKMPPTELKHIRVPIDVYRVREAAESPERSGDRPPRTRLAVLPFANISPDPKDEYFADGLTEEVISSLSKLRELRVIARTSVSQYKSTTKSVAQIGAELDVGSILEGSVRKAGDRLRITLQLVDSATEEHIWTESYDRTLDDVFAIQSDIAERTAGALRLGLLGSEKASIDRRPTSTVAAYEWYLKGLHSFRLISADPTTGSPPAIGYFEEAIRQDPKFSLAYSALANALIGFSGNVLDPKDALPRAKELIGKAIETDPFSSDAHSARGNLALQYEHNWVVAEEEFSKAIALNPSNAGAHFWYSLLLGVLQRFDQAIEEATTASELDPLWEIPRVQLGSFAVVNGDLPRAIAIGEELVGRQPGQPLLHVFLGNLYLFAGRRDDARRQVELATGQGGRMAEVGAAVLWANLGEPDRARRFLAAEPERTEYVNLAAIASLHLAVGEVERAFDCLERDARSDGATFPFSYLTPAFDPIRADPRFVALLSRFRLPLRPIRTTRARPTARRSRRD